MSAPAVPRSGPANALTDVGGLSGRATTRRRARGTSPGTTVILAPGGGMVAGVDVRGGGPGTRETDILPPLAAVETVHAIVLTGGSAYGLAAASGVADALGDKGIGLQVGAGAGPGGADRAGRRTVRPRPRRRLPGRGRIRPSGAGRSRRRCPIRRGARTRILRSRVRGRGDRRGLRRTEGRRSARRRWCCRAAIVVAALVVVNAVGIPVRSGHRRAVREPVPDARATRPHSECRPRRTEDRLRSALANRPSGPRSADAAELPTASYSMRNTTIGVIATDATLTKAQCAKLAGVGHDGLAQSAEPGAHAVRRRHAVRGVDRDGSGPGRCSGSRRSSRWQPMW